MSPPALLLKLQPDLNLFTEECSDSLGIDCIVSEREKKN